MVIRNNFSTNQFYFRIGQKRALVIYMFFLGASTLLIAFLPDDSKKFEYNAFVIFKMCVALLARAMVSGAYTTI